MEEQSEFTPSPNLDREVNPELGNNLDEASPSSGVSFFSKFKLPLIILGIIIVLMGSTAYLYAETPILNPLIESLGFKTLSNSIQSKTGLSLFIPTNNQATNNTSNSQSQSSKPATGNSPNKVNNTQTPQIGPTPQPTVSPPKTSPSPTPTPKPSPPPPTPTPTPTPTPSPTPTPPPSNNSVPNYDHIVWILMENTGYSGIVGNSSAPYLNSLVNSYGVAANYFATDHPSQPNYLELTSGTNAGISDDCTPPGSGCTANVTNLGDRIEAAGKTWKAYMEDATSTCPAHNVNSYYTKHDPWVVYNDIRTNSSRCNAHVVPYPQLSSDLANLPNFVFITPNQCNDMHDCSTQTGDNWLSQQVPTILNSPAFTKQSSLLVIVWDEDDGSGNNRVAAIFAGSKLKRGFQSHTQYTHYSLLHTVESAWGLAPLTANDLSAPLMTDMFDASLADTIKRADTITSSGTYLGFLIVKSFDWSVGLFVPLGITVNNTLALSGQALGLGTNVSGVGQIAGDVSTDRLRNDENTQAFLLIVFTMGIISILTLPVVVLIQFILGKFGGVFWKRFKPESTK